MPELPEVQTIINYLIKNIKNLKIKKIEIKKDKFLKNTTVEDFSNKLKNTTIINIERIGKYLIFILSNNLYMVVHLRMEGKFYIDHNFQNRKHDYLIFHLSNNEYLVYNDSRQFGTFHLTNNLNNLKEINKISPDPLSSNFDIKFFIKKIKSSKKNIKSLLMDQTYISGIGNIYASEILFDAKISPFKNGNQLSEKDIENIVESSKKILTLAIKHNGTTIHSYHFGQDSIGEFYNYLKVVNRENKNCQNCNYKIIRIKQNSRSTFYCPNCQKN